MAGNRFEQKHARVIYATIALLIAVIFLVDSYTPLGVTAWITYLLPIVLSLFVWRPVVPFAIAALASVLIIISYFVSWAGVTPEFVLINNGIGVLTIWLVATICCQFIQNKCKLQASRDELEERTIELERRNQALRDFTYITTHDLREPLRKIQTFGSLLEAKSVDLNEQEREYVSRMTRTASRMRELLDALLRYTSVDRKGQEFRSIRLNEVVHDAAGELEIAIRNIEAHVEVGSLPTVEGDPYQLRQLFQNLIANAVKYHRSEIRTVIKIYGEEKDGKGSIFVEDNGIGFDEKYLDKIFQPFQRLQGKYDYPGTGVGLAICKRIVERHRGTITAKSTAGKGSMFIVTLPLSPKVHVGKS
jgi:signal transduction histidine kinase